MPVATRFCSQCGAKLGETVRFCETCGTPVAAQPAPPPAPPVVPGSISPASPIPAATATPQPSRPAAKGSCFGIFAGWVIVIGAFFWMLPEGVRYLQLHFKTPELLADILAAVLCFLAGCAVISGAKRNKFLFGGILALLFGTLSVLDLLTRVSNIQFVLEDPLQTFVNAPAHKWSIIAFASGSVFGDFLIALGCLLTLFAWIGSGRAKR